MKKYDNEKGMIIITILAMTVVLMILASTMVALNYENLGFSTIMERKEKALRIAESGVVYALYSLSQDPYWGLDRASTPSVKMNMEKLKGRFEITFDQSSRYYSSNCLLNDFPMVAGDPNNTVWEKAAMPKYSFDLVVTGILTEGNKNTVKRLRVLIQRDANFNSTFASGLIGVSANNFDLSKEVTAQNPNEGGTIHSNSIKNPAIKTCGFDPNFSIDTQIILHGGTASANGDIDITNANLDVANGSTVDPVKSSKYVNPIDIDKTIEYARNRTDGNILKVDGKTFVVYKDHIEPPITADTSAVEVIDGKVYIKKDILFKNDNVRFEFNYADLESLENKAKDVGIYLQDPGDSTKQPSFYIDGGKDITVAGAVKGNGGIYSSGKASFIGESNLVGPHDTGTVIICKSDLNIQLPSISEKPLGIDFTGLVYTHGNANISILDPNDPTNPANNFSGGKWPSNWEDMYLKQLSVKTNEIALMKNEEGTAYGKAIFENASGETWKFSIDSGYGVITKNTDGTFAFQKGKDSTGRLLLDYTYTTASGGIYTTSSSRSRSGSDVIVGGGTTTTVNLEFDSDTVISPDTVLNGSNLKGMTAEQVNSMFTALKDYFSNYVQPSSSSDKIDPNFRINGALVAIDPNNPVPDANNPDTDMAGNIKINIFKFGDPMDPNGEGGDLLIKYAPRYLKHLEAARTITGFKCVYWTEI